MGFVPNFFSNYPQNSEDVILDRLKPIKENEISHSSNFILFLQTYKIAFSFLMYRNGRFHLFE